VIVQRNAKFCESVEPSRLTYVEWLFVSLQLGRNAKHQDIEVFAPQKPFESVIEAQQFQSSPSCTVESSTPFLDEQQPQLHESTGVLFNGLTIKVTADHDLLFLRADSRQTKDIRDYVKLVSFLDIQSNVTTFSNLENLPRAKNGYFSACNMLKEN
jgi:hypothetical protein